MKTYVPNYYKKFKCIGGKCTHNCCIGWEIDIDEETREKYRNASKRLPGEFSERLKSCISESTPPSFILADKERCPFLNKDNLCDIHIELGEEYLCEICADHPRFRNYFANTLELGLGLSCEEVARIITTETEPFTVITLEDDDIGNVDEDYEEFASFRNQIISILQDHDWTVWERINNLFDYLGIEPIKKETSAVAKVYEKLERLDSVWTECLNKLLSVNNTYVDEYITKFDQTPLEQLLCYFIFRSLSDALYEDDYGESLQNRIKYSVLSVYVICAVAETSNISLCEAARMYSAEIEYSDENVDVLLSYVS